MDKPAKIVAITGEHVILEGETIEIVCLEETAEVTEPMLEILDLVKDEPETDPYNTSTVKVLRPGTRKGHTAIEWPRKC